MLELKPFEIMKCGGGFLVKFNCPKCNTECLCGLDNKFCQSCGTFDAVYDLSEVTRWRNVIAHEDQIRRKKISVVMVRRLRTLQEGKCAYCFADLGVEFHVDHIMPLSFGGSNNEDNLALACPRCNLIAGNKVFQTMFGKSQYILSRLYPKTFKFTTI
jgi:hypothetical protein